MTQIAKLTCGCTYNLFYKKWNFCSDHRASRARRSGFVVGLFTASAIVVVILTLNYVFDVGLRW